MGLFIDYFYPPELTDVAQSLWNEGAVEEALEAAEHTMPETVDAEQVSIYVDACSDGSVGLRLRFDEFERLTLTS
jgi:deoxyhypusine synthase